MVKYILKHEIVREIGSNIPMNNTKILEGKGCTFPPWINSEELIRALLTYEGPELYSFFGYNDTTSCSKFLAKFIPGKPKSTRYTVYVRDLLK